MKKIIFIIIAILVAATSALFINKGKTMDKSNIYTVIAPNEKEVWLDKNTNLIVAKPDSKIDAKSRIANKEASKLVLEARSILDSSPYKKP